MSAKIVKIRLINYKRFRDFTIKPNERINILIGDNEVGKSSILNAIDLEMLDELSQLGLIIY